MEERRAKGIEAAAGPRIPAAATAAGASAPRRNVAELELCPSCTSRLVYPIDWSPVTGRRWKVALRCPNCEWRSMGVYAQDAVDRFDEVLDRGTEGVLTALRGLSRDNMERDVERFCAALGAGAILPEDF